MIAFTLTLVVLIVPAVFAANEECTSKEQCTAVDGVTCVSPGETRSEECTTYKCRKSGKVLEYQIVKKLLRCERPDGTCMNRGMGEKNEERCIFETCRQRRKSDGSFTMVYKERAYGCPMDDGTCLRFGKRNALTSQDKCTVTTCKKRRNKKGVRSTLVKEKYFGCPHDGKCMKDDETRTADCTTYRCELTKRRTMMKWAIIQTGCNTEEGCKYDGEEWSDLDAPSCVVRRCDVTYDGNKYTRSNTVAKHGCRATNGMCYYDDETWPESDCYTRRCEVSETEDGKSMASTKIDSGVCQDADGSCKSYGESFKYRAGSELLDCVCEKTTSENGYPQGSPRCAVP